jgi:hypothetical protein
MKDVMNRAWEISKEAAKKFGGKPVEYIAEALRMAWKEIKSIGKKIIDRIEELEKIGFKRWQKGNMDRLYINASMLGLNYGRYNTGNIKWAEFQGNSISNCQARRMLSAKTYIDVKTERVYSDSETLRAAAAELAKIA